MGPREAATLVTLLTERFPLDDALKETNPEEYKKQLR